MKLAELAAGIDAHLKRFEKNKRINRLRKRGTLRVSTYFGAGAFANGRYVSVRYLVLVQREMEFLVASASELK